MATTSGAMPGEMTAAVRRLPCWDVTSTMSPSLIPRRAAVVGLISIQLLHIAEVSGSGISCSHGRCAVEPSRNWFDGYGRKWNGYWSAAPSNSGSTNAAEPAPPPATGAAVASAAGSVPHQPPFSWASVHVSIPSLIDGSAANDAANTSSNVCQGSSTGICSRRPRSSSTSGIARVSYSGIITGAATLATDTSDPDSGSPSDQDSRNEWSGRIRSARMLVSSRKLPKLTMYGTFWSASRSFQARGAVNTGFTPSTSSTFTGGSLAPSRSDAIVCNGSTSLAASPSERLAGAPAPRAPVTLTCGVKYRPPGCPTLPTSAFKAFTASAVNKPLVCASGGPPTTASDGPRSANSRASRSTRAAA